MNRYTIYCTKEQTKKAIELGVPIKFEETFRYNWKDGRREPYPDIAVDKNGKPILIIPTVEQMIGWLEEQVQIGEIYITKYLNEDGNYFWFFDFYDKECNCLGNGRDYSSRKEATLAVIDAALEYLSNNKKDYEKSIV